MATAFPRWPPLLYRAARDKSEWGCRLQRLVEAGEDFLGSLAQELDALSEPAGHVLGEAVGDKGQELLESLRGRWPRVEADVDLAARALHGLEQVVDGRRLGASGVGHASCEMLPEARAQVGHRNHCLGSLRH